MSVVAHFDEAPEPTRFGDDGLCPADDERVDCWSTSVSIVVYPEFPDVEIYQRLFVRTGLHRDKAQLPFTIQGIRDGVHEVLEHCMGAEVHMAKHQFDCALRLARTEIERREALEAELAELEKRRRELRDELKGVAA